MGSTKNGQPVIKGVGELQSAAINQDHAAKSSLYGDVPTAAQIMEKENQAAAARKMAQTSAMADYYEKVRRSQGAGAQPQADPAASATAKRRSNLIAGGAQPNEADKIIAGEAAPKPQEPKPSPITKAAPTIGGSAISPAPAPAVPSPSMGIGSDANLTDSALTPPAPSAPTPAPKMSMINDGGVTMPMKDWIKAKHTQESGDVPQLPAAAKGGRVPCKKAAKGGRTAEAQEEADEGEGQPVLAGEAGNELKINDDETMEPIHGPQVITDGKPGVIIPHKELMKMAKKYDKPIKGGRKLGSKGMKCAANGGRLTSADGLIGNANAASPVGIGGVINMPGQAPGPGPVPGVSTGQNVTSSMTIGKSPAQKMIAQNAQNRVPGYGVNMVL